MVITCRECIRSIHNNGLGTLCDTPCGGFSQFISIHAEPLVITPSRFYTIEGMDGMKQIAPNIKWEE